MYSGYVTDIKGILVGHYTDEANKTGVTAILCPGGAVCGSDVRGGAPGTRETDLTKPGHLVEKAHAVVLSGGSAYGLAAASGVMNALEKRGAGMDVGVAKVPIVPAAVIFDLAFGAADVRPGEREGMIAAETASAEENRQGYVGAGTGATVGKCFGAACAQRGGLGSATVELPDGVKVSAMVVVNALGDIRDEEGRVIRGAQKDGVFLNTAEQLLNGKGIEALPGANTTIGCIVTNAILTKEQANRVATVAHNGYALAIRPVHTMLDGDTIFALATCEKPAKTDLICLAAQTAMQRAIINVGLMGNANDAK